MSNTLKSGASLAVGQQLVSENGTFNMILQTDGNFVLYRGTKALWASNTQGVDAAKVTMEKGGNLVLLDTGNNVVWESATDGEPGAYLIVQDDGNAVIYISTGAIWATNTSDK